MFLIIGNMTMPKNNHTRLGKLSLCHFHTIMRVPENMHNTNAAMAYDHLALDRQFLNNLLVFDIALDSHDRRERFKLINDRKTRYIASMDDEFYLREMG